MAISKTQNYLVLNYSASPVGVSTKYDSFLVDGGSEESPGSLPLSFDEIAVINSKSVVFKIGILRFEPAVEAELYEALAIPHWQDILKQSQIEDILLHPNMEDMQRLLDIDNEAYFERVRGAMVSLKNRGADVANNTVRLIEARRTEFAQRKRKTALRLTPTAEKQTQAQHTQEEFDSMKNELAELKAMMAQMMKASEVKESKSAAKEETKTAPKQEKQTTTKQKAKEKDQ